MTSISRKCTTPNGLVYRDRRPAGHFDQRVSDWQFRSTSPGPATQAFARPLKVSTGSGQVLASGLKYPVRSVHTSLDNLNTGMGIQSPACVAPRDPRHSLQPQGVKRWPTSLRKAVWSARPADKDRRVQDTGQRVRMLVQRPNVATQIFASYALPLSSLAEPVMLFTSFQQCLSNLEALQGSCPTLHLAIEMAGVPNHEKEAVNALLSPDEVKSIFEAHAEWYDRGEEDERGISSHTTIPSGSGAFALTKKRFMACLLRVADELDDRLQTLNKKVPKAKPGMNRRLPIKELLELRGQGKSSPNRATTPVSPSQTTAPKAESPRVRLEAQVHSPIASIAAMRKEIDPASKQAALFKALKAETMVSEYKALARQVAREAMVQLDAAVKALTKTRKELEWLMILRDQALASLGLLVTNDQVMAAAAAADHGLKVAGDGNTATGSSASAEVEGQAQSTSWRGPPSWAWLVPSDSRKPITPVMDGWYLVSGDVGPRLRLAGPLGSQTRCRKAINDFFKLGIQVFEVSLLRESAVVQTFSFDAAGQSIDETKQADKTDGWYVMMADAEKRCWTLRLELSQLDRELQAFKQEATGARKRLLEVQGLWDMQKERLEERERGSRARSSRRKDDSLAGELEEELQHNMTEEDLVLAQERNAEAMGRWKTGLKKKRELEAQMAAAKEELAMGRSDLLTVEGPMALEIMARQYILQKKSRRVQTALRVVRIESSVMTVSNWRPDDVSLADDPSSSSGPRHR